MEFKFIFLLKQKLSEQSGQSILETLLMLPLMFFLIFTVYRMNLAAQSAINNIQYARTQVFRLTNNSAEYPRNQFRFNKLGNQDNKRNQFNAQQSDRMILGVSDKTSETGSTIEPHPQIQKLLIGNGKKGSDEIGEVKERSELRIRITAAICTPFSAIKSDGRDDFVSSNIVNLGSKRWPFGIPVCRFHGRSDGV